jgi:hypothetical protein
MPSLEKDFISVFQNRKLGQKKQVLLSSIFVSRPSQPKSIECVHGCRDYLVLLRITKTKIPISAITKPRMKTAPIPWGMATSRSLSAAVKWQ